MENYKFKTELPCSTNSDTMRVFLLLHARRVFSGEITVILDDGSYVELVDKDDRTWAVNAGGDGDFFSHLITFELLNNGNEE